MEGARNEGTYQLVHAQRQVVDDVYPGAALDAAALDAEHAVVLLGTTECLKGDAVTQRVMHAICGHGGLWLPRQESIPPLPALAANVLELQVIAEALELACTLPESPRSMGPPESTHIPGI